MKFASRRPGNGLKPSALALTTSIVGLLGAKTLEMTAPDAPGSYTLRYYNADNKAVLAETPISVR